MVASAGAQHLQEQLEAASGQVSALRPKLELVRVDTEHVRASHILRTASLRVGTITDILVLKLH